MSRYIRVHHVMHIAAGPSTAPGSTLSHITTAQLLLPLPSLLSGASAHTRATTDVVRVWGGAPAHGARVHPVRGAGPGTAPGSTLSHITAAAAQLLPPLPSLLSGASIGTCINDICTLINVYMYVYVVYIRIHACIYICIHIYTINI